MAIPAQISSPAANPVPESAAQQASATAATAAESAAQQASATAAMAAESAAQQASATAAMAAESAAQQASATAAMAAESAAQQASATAAMAAESAAQQASATAAMAAESAAQQASATAAMAAESAAQQASATAAMAAESAAQQASTTAATAAESAAQQASTTAATAAESAAQQASTTAATASQSAALQTATIASPLSLDLGSTSADLVAPNSSPVSILLGGSLSGNGTIDGGAAKIINPGDLVTPAEYGAVTNLLQAGAQSILLNDQGQAIGGSLTLTPQTFETTANLNVPESVSLNLINFNSSSPFSLAGDAVINGAVYSFHDTANVSSVLNLGSLTVTTTGLLSGNVPTSNFFSSNTFSSLFPSSALLIYAASSVVNNGLISAPGALTINAGAQILNSGIISGASVALNAGQQITNSSSIAALAGSINLNSVTGQFYNSGTIEAALGSINIGAASASQAATSIAFNNAGGALLASNTIDFVGQGGPIGISGGDLLSAVVNVNGGEGKVSVDVDNLSGIINASGYDLQISTRSGNLNLGNIEGSGDPRVSNTGNVNITASIIGNPIAIYAGGNITDSGGAAKTIDSQGGDLFLAAGVLFAGNAGNETITGATTSGGSIVLNDGNLTITTSGGNLLAIAQEGTSGTSGRVQLTPGGGSITTGGGSLTVIAEESSTGVDAVSLTSINTSGGGPGAGAINLSAATINQSENVLVSNTGALLNPSGLNAYSAGTLTNGGVRVNRDVTADGAQISMKAGGRIQIEGVINNSTNSAAAGTITLQSTGNSVRVDNDGGAAAAVNNANAGGAGGTIIISSGGSAGDVIVDGPILNTSTGAGGTVTLSSANDDILINGPGALDGNLDNSTSGGNGGTITITSGDDSLIDGVVLNNSTGNSGTINITGTSGSVTVNNGGAAAVAINNSSSAGNGNNITLSASGGSEDVIVRGTIQNTSSGPAGNINITSTNDTVQIAANGASTANIVNTSANGSAGTINIVGQNAVTVDGFINNSTTSASGSISLTSNNSTVSVGNDALNSFAINNSTSGGNGGTVTISSGGSAGDVIVDGPILNTSTGAGGTVTLSSANDDILINGPGALDGNLDNSTSGGNGGTITITSGDDSLIDGVVLNNSTGNSGTINITGTSGSVTVNNGGAAAVAINNSSSAGNGNNITLSASGGSEDVIVRGTIQNTSSGPAGNINITSTNDTVQIAANGASTANIVNTSANGSAGTINIVGQNAVTVDGFINNSTTSASGSISLTSNNSTVSVGNDALNSFAINNSTSGGNGGTVTISSGGSAGDVIVDGPILNTSTGAGGTITLSSANDDILIGNPSNVLGTINNSTTSGPGGTITTSSADDTLIRGDLLNTASGAGGTVNLISTGGRIDILDNTAGVASVNNSSTGGSAGTVTISASGPNSGSGGSNGRLYIEGSVNNSSSTGGGSTSLISANSTVIVDNNAGAASAVTSSAINGAAGSITARSGTNLGIDGSVAADGSAAGNGGSILLQYANAAGGSLVVGGTGTRFVNGTVSADASGTGKGGNIEIRNGTGAAGTPAGNLNISLPGTITANGASGLVSDMGRITLSSAGFNVTVSGAGSLIGCIQGTGNNVSLTTGSGDLHIGVPGGTPGTLTATAGNLSLTANGGSVNFKNDGTATGNISVQTNNTGSISVQNGATVSAGNNLTFTSRSVSLASSTTVTSGGNLLLDSNAAGNPLAVSLGTGANLTSTGGSVLFNQAGAGNEGQITITGLGNISGTTLNYNTGANNLSATANSLTGNNLVNGVSGNATAVTFSTQTGNIAFGAGINTSIAAGNGGPVSIDAAGGSIDLAGNDINSSGGGAGNNAGAISLSSSGGLTNGGNLIANGTAGASGGTISTTGAGQDIIVNSIQVSGAANGGSFTNSSGNLRVVGIGPTGNSIDASGTTGNGGVVSITTTAGNPFILGDPSVNGTASGIVAGGGTNGGRVTITSNGATVQAGQSVSANGGAGNGGVVTFNPSSATPSVGYNIQGSVSATGSGATGIIGFGTLPSQTMTLTVGGSLTAGQQITLGGLDPTTGLPAGAPGGVFTVTPSALPLTSPPAPFNTPLIVVNGIYPVPPAVPVSMSTPPVIPGSTINPVRITARDNTRPEGVGTFIATDQTRILEGSVSKTEIPMPATAKGLIPASKTYQSRFQTGEINRLRKEGNIIANSSENGYLDLDRGNIIFAPDKDIVVSVNEGTVHIPAGAIVAILENGADSAILDLHQSGPNGVKIVSERKLISLHPGKMIVLSRSTSDDFEEINHECKQIGYMNPKTKQLSKEVRAFGMYFSIPSAIKKLQPLRTMVSSHERQDQKTLQKLLMNSVLLREQLPYKGPFMTTANINP
ncbi:MAG: S-layer family protein [Candidatus Melainabacteria bacterium]|nr:S-layer family protein [Candidatus Melainabacteria bacterium]